jgi:hypothetical protein
MPKPIMFVGSSSEDKGLIEGLRLNLKGNVSVRSWATTTWALSRSTLTGIEKHLDEADFAAFILNANDVAVIRDKRENIPRDNVLFELGMSFGRIRRDRTFILVPQGASTEIRTLSDLLGITGISFEPDGSDQQTMATAAAELWVAIQDIGPRSHRGINGALERGDTIEIDRIADSALHVFESRDKSVDELKKAVLDGERVPAKFQFAQPDGGRYWLKLCRGKYSFFERAKAQLHENRTLIAEKISNAAETSAVDLISLGCGDGTKDSTLLRALTHGLVGQEQLYYYPIDISDILLVESIRKISRSGLERNRFRCKAVLGDFTDLSSLAKITGYRSNPNLFSVLGNTLGSFDESDIVDSVAAAMQPGDLVLIEVNVGDPADSLALLEEDAASQWDLSTLDALGIERESCAISQDMKTGVSMFPGTQTLISSAVPRNDGNSKYMLSAMHHYEFETLKERITKDLDIVLIEDIAEDGVGLLLGQRQH